MVRLVACDDTYTNLYNNIQSGYLYYIYIYINIYMYIHIRFNNIHIRFNNVLSQFICINVYVRNLIKKHTDTQ
jgi:hypothetical protein